MAITDAQQAKQIMMKKGGPVHRHQLAKKNTDGSRPGYYGPDEGHENDPGHGSNSNMGGGNGGNNNQGDGGWENTQSYEDFNKTPVNTSYQPGSGSQTIQDYLEDEQKVNEQKIQEQNDAWLNEHPRWKTHIETKQKKEYHDNISKVMNDIKKQPNVKLRQKAIDFVVRKAAMSHPITAIAYGVAKLFGWKGPQVSTDISGNIIGKNTVTGSDLGFFDPKEYPEFWGKGPDDTKDGSEAPVVAPVTEEIEDSYAMAGNWLQGYRDLKAKQALSASLQEKWADERQWQQETMFANSGGLANLFRVKNQ